MLLSQVIERFESLWPVGHAEAWDSVGLVVGSAKQNVTKVLLTVDVTDEVIAEAKQIGADLILAHHPLLLKGIDTVQEQTSKGFILSELIRSGIALYSAHTNADSQISGTSAVLAKHIGLANTSALAPNEFGAGIGIIGNLSAPTTLGEIAGLLNKILPQTATGIRVAGDFNRAVTKVALCAGAGDSYLQVALDSGADLYITSDLRHHPAQEILQQAKARSIEFSLMDISHWAAEYLWLDQAGSELADLGIELVVSDIRTDVFDFLLNAPKEI